METIHQPEAIDSLKRFLVGHLCRPEQPKTKPIVLVIEGPDGEFTRVRIWTKRCRDQATRYLLVVDGRGIPRRILCTTTEQVFGFLVKWPGEATAAQALADSDVRHAVSESKPKLSALTLV